MIVGKPQSMDGMRRRIPIRHTQIVSKDTKMELLSYIPKMVYEKCHALKRVGTKDIFTQIPNDLFNTPLEILYTICTEKFGNEPKNVNINISKYVGMPIREAIYYSNEEYVEKIQGSIRTYSFVSNKLNIENDGKE